MSGSVIGNSSFLRMLPLVMMVLVVACLALVGHAEGAEQDPKSSLTLTCGLMIAVAPAILTGLLSWGISRWQSLRDIQKIQEQLEAQYSAERRTRATQVSDALLFQAELLGTQLEAMKEMLADTKGKALELWNWFAEIKEEAEKGSREERT